MYSKESVIEIDYKSLPAELKALEDSTQLRQAMTTLAETITSLTQQIESMAPNMKAVERYGLGLLSKFKTCDSL